VEANFQQPTLLNTPRFRLRKLDSIDYDALYLAASDPLIWEQHPSKRHIETVFSDWFDLALEHGHVLVIEDKALHKIVGTTRFYDINEAERSIAIGYTFITRDYWGNGSNQEIKAYMFEYAFTWAKRIWLHIAPTNARSRKAAEKLGVIYSHEGIIVDSDIAHCFYYIERKN
jgi:RimJ/RimL family protein N-acetyltransferase